MTVCTSAGKRDGSSSGLLGHVGLTPISAVLDSERGRAESACSGNRHHESRACDH